MSVMYRETFPLHRSIRDNALLDSLESVRSQEYDGIVWRSVKEHRNPMDGFNPQGRWDDGSFAVLYTSESKHVAVEERFFHIHQGQSVIPSKIQYRMYTLRVQLQAVLDLANFDYLRTLGINVSQFGQLSYLNRSQEYERSQDIAEVCKFLGADGILVPSARIESERNLVIFCDSASEQSIRIHADEGLFEIPLS